MVGALLESMKRDGIKVPSQKKYLDSLVDHIHVILCNLIHASSEGSDIYVDFSRDSLSYSGTSMSYRNVIKTTDYLYERGYIEMTVGRPTYGGVQGNASTMKATGKLRAMVTAIAGDPHSIVIYRDKPTSELVVMKGKKVKTLKKGKNGKPKLDRFGRKQYEDERKVVKTPDNRKVRQIIEEIQIINRVNGEARIALNLDQHELEWVCRRLGNPIDFTRTQMYRIFHDRRTDRHGRWYGPWWQGIHEDFRHRIMINDNPVVELDYSFFHPSMLYCMEGVQIPPKDDLYLLPDDRKDKPWRTLLKILTLSMINASTKEGAVGATIGKWKKNTVKDKKWGREPLVEPVLLEYHAIMPLIPRILERHKPIRHHFLTGIGSKLMYEDSSIATEVILYFAEQGIPCLPVHDSFIVEQEHSLECWNVMQQAFTDRFGQSIPIDYQSAVDVYSRYRDKPSALPMSENWEQKETEIHDVLCEDQFSGEDMGR